MSFGFSVGDFVAAGQLAHSIWTRCQAAAGDFEELGALCEEINIAVGACQPNDPRSILRTQRKEAITRLSASCLTTLERLEKILDDHQDMNGIQGLGKKFGFIGSKSEREQIRSRLQFHLTTINTFLANVQVETSALTVRLLFSVLKEQFGDCNEDTIRGIIDNPDTLQDLFKEVRSENKLLNAELDNEKDSIQAKLKEAMDHGQQDLGTGTAADDLKIQVARVTLMGPSAPNSTTYNPWKIDWFRDGGYMFLTPITAQDQLQLVPLKGPIMGYSKNEEWLCQFPEGWSAITTTLSRNDKRELAMYYTSNKMSRKSRAYFFKRPFDFDGMAMTYEQYQATNRRIFVQKQRYSGRSRENIHVQGIGFCHNDLPYDLGDDVSRLLASKYIGPLGVHKVLSEKDIDDSLPDDWSYFWQKEGTNQIVYVDHATETESTVHPARFNSPEDEPGSHVLPPGWQRRLDTWGNIFFGDHHTHRAVREDPRFNSKINQKTGLPDGWLAIEDHKSTPFFYRKSGCMVIGTYDSAAMKSKSLRDKWTLSRVPEQGEDPELLVKITTPLARQAFEDRKKARDAAAALAASTAIPPMTPEEELHYHSIFESVEKEDPFRVNYKEALTLCSTFNVPVKLAAKVLDQTDSNFDRKWNVNEYANALHHIKIKIRREHRDAPLQAITAAEEQEFAVMFNAGKSPASQTMTLSEFNAVCKDLGISERRSKKIFRVLDYNADSRLNIDEFKDAMHIAMRKVKEMEALSKLEPPEPKSTQDADTTSNQQSASEAHKSPPEDEQVSDDTGEQPQNAVLSSPDSSATGGGESLRCSAEPDAIVNPLIPPAATQPAEPLRSLEPPSASSPVPDAEVQALSKHDANPEPSPGPVEVVT